jgi:putative transposase
MLTSSDVSRWRRQMHRRARRCKAKQGRPGKTALTYESCLHNSTDFAPRTRGVKDLFPNTHLEVISSVAHLPFDLTPQGADGISRALGEAHRRYTNFINARGRWTGHLFQSRFASVAMDESHLRSAVSYVSLNPVRARLVSRAEEWAWSSVRAHLVGEDDSLVSVRPVLGRWPNFRDLLEDCEEKFISLREAEGIGRPLGTADFVTELERRLGRSVARRAPGRKAVAIPVGERLNLQQ